jgi:hypothetical protein
MSWNKRFIELNCSELMQKQSLSLRYHFTAGSPFLKSLCNLMLRTNEETNPESDLFKGFFFNPENFAYVKLSAKNRQNKVGSRHSSALLLEHACGQDFVRSLKFGVRLGQVSSSKVGDHFAVNASTELINGINLSLLKSKFFLRRTTPLTDDAAFEL